MKSKPTVKRYEAYLTKHLTVNIIGTKNGKAILEEDTKLYVDPVTHLALYNQYEIQLYKTSYGLVN